MLPAITYEIISCGSQRSAIKDLTVRRLVRGRSQPSGFFSSTPIVQVCYGIIQPEDIPLPRIRMGDVRALSQEECDRLLRTIATNPSPFRKTRDRTMIVTFLLTGARLRELVHLLPLADSAKMDLNVYLKQPRRRSRTKALFISCWISLIWFPHNPLNRIISRLEFLYEESADRSAISSRGHTRS